MDAKEYRDKEAITDANFWNGNEINFEAIYEFAEAYANQSKPDVSEVKDKKEKVKNCKLFFEIYSRNYPRLETLSSEGKKELYKYAVDFCNKH